MEPVPTQRLPKFIADSYEALQCKHALTILQGDFKSEWDDIVDVMSAFRLKKAHIEVGGGNKSKVACDIDSALTAKGWKEHKFETKVVVDGAASDSPTHKVDCFKNRVALEIEWNNKDPFFDRDLNNFRLLFDLRVISVGVIVTRCDELSGIFRYLKRNKSYGMSTTHMSKLVPKVDGGGGGGCPILVLGIRSALFDDANFDPTQWMQKPRGKKT